MSIEFTITICTMIIGFLGMILMIWQINLRIDSLRGEFKADTNRLESRFESDIKELRGLILGLYNPALFDKINKKDAA